MDFVQGDVVTETSNNREFVVLRIDEEGHVITRQIAADGRAKGRRNHAFRPDDLRLMWRPPSKRA